MDSTDLGRRKRQEWVVGLNRVECDGETGLFLRCAWIHSVTVLELNNHRDQRDPVALALVLE